MNERDLISGGKADDKSIESFDAGDLKKGVKVEMEHTDDPKVALEISTDHLTEFPNYYGVLSIMEDALKALDAAKSSGNSEAIKDITGALEHVATAAKGKPTKNAKDDDDNDEYDGLADSETSVLDELLEQEGERYADPQKYSATAWDYARDASKWVPYTGPHGGHGLKNLETGDIDYETGVNLMPPTSQPSSVSERVVVCIQYGDDEPLEKEYPQGSTVDDIERDVHGFLTQSEPQSYVKDASGHEHKPKGPGGGQFTGGEGFSLQPSQNPPKQPKFESTGGKQQALFSTTGQPGQMNLFKDAAVPDELLPKHLRGGAEATASAARLTSLPQFTSDFNDTFDRIAGGDRTTSIGPKEAAMVSIHDLRTRMPQYSDDEFKQHLRELRKTGQYGLEPAGGIGTNYSPEAAEKHRLLKEHGIKEGNTLFAYVTRRQPQGGQKRLFGRDWSEKRQYQKGQMTEYTMYVYE